MIAFISLPLAAEPHLNRTRSFVKTLRQRSQDSYAHQHVPRARLEGSSNISSNSLSTRLSLGNLNAAEFDELFLSKRLPLCLVGMSNCGKSYWSGQLQEMHDFNCVCVDDEIESAMKPELEELGYSGIADMAKWMGYPSNDRFAANEKRYLQLEESITSKVVPPLSSNFVLDTTGSVVYLSAETHQYLRDNFLVVHLAATDDMLERMRISYFESPKPVVWGDSYSEDAGETPMDALRRCYDGLLQERLKRYYALSHVSVPAALAFSDYVNANHFIDHVRAQL